MTTTLRVSAGSFALALLAGGCAGSTSEGSGATGTEAGTGAETSTAGDDGGTAAESGSSEASTTRTLTAFTTPNGTTVPTGFGTKPGTCAQQTRDTSSCQAARTALGLSGNWLSFSCNVVEGLATSSQAATTSLASATYVSLMTANLPDFASKYYPTTGSYDFTANGYTVTGTYDSLYSAFTTAFPDSEHDGGADRHHVRPPGAGSVCLGLADDERDERGSRRDGD